MPFRVAVAVTVVLAATLVHSGIFAQPREPFTIALTGDSIIMQRLQVFKEPEFTKLFDLIRGAARAPRC